MSAAKWQKIAGFKNFFAKELLNILPQNLQPEVYLNVPFPSKGQGVPEI
jgi:hypothetical protein